MATFYTIYSDYNGYILCIANVSHYTHILLYISNFSIDYYLLPTRGNNNVIAGLAQKILFFISKTPELNNIFY